MARHNGPWRNPTFDPTAWVPPRARGGGAHGLLNASGPPGWGPVLLATAGLAFLAVLGWLGMVYELL